MNKNKQGKQFNAIELTNNSSSFDTLNRNKTYLKGIFIFHRQKIIIKGK